LAGLSATLPALLDDQVGSLFAEAIVIRADVSLRNIRGLHIDLHRIDACFISLLEQTRIGLNVRAVHDYDVGLLGDELGQRLRPSLRAPVWIAHNIGIAKLLGLLGELR